MEESSDDEPNPFSFKNFSQKSSQPLPQAPLPAVESSSDDSESGNYVFFGWFSLQKNGFGMPNGARDEDFIHIDDVDEEGSSFLYVPYRKRSSQSILDESDGEGDDTRPYSHADRHSSFHDPNIIRRSKLKVAGNLVVNCC